jgi:hypothetical protein
MGEVMSQTLISEMIITEAALRGLYDGTMRNDPEYQKMVEKISANVRVGWMRKLTAAMLGKSARLTVAKALEAAGYPLPKVISPEGDYFVHDEWLVHEVAQWIDYMRSKPRTHDMMLIAQQRRNFHRTHQFKGYAKLTVRGARVPVWVPNR